MALPLYKQYNLYLRISLLFDFFCFPSINLVHDTGLENHLEEGVARVLLLAERSHALPGVWGGGRLVDHSVHLTQQFVILIAGLHQLTSAQQRLLVILSHLWSLRAKLRQEIHEEWSVEVLTELIQHKPVTNSLGCCPPNIN